MSQTSQTVRRFGKAEALRAATQQALQVQGGGRCRASELRKKRDKMQRRVTIMEVQLAGDGEGGPRRVRASHAPPGGPQYVSMYPSQLAHTSAGSYLSASQHALFSPPAIAGMEYGGYQIEFR